MFYQLNCQLKPQSILWALRLKEVFGVISELMRLSSYRLNSYIRLRQFITV